MGTASPYCASRFQSVRRHAREVRVGNVYVGADHPIRIQSMTTTETLDVEATYRQSVDLVEAGCEIVRITAPNVRAAKALGSISKKLDYLVVGNSKPTKKKIFLISISK